MADLGSAQMQGAGGVTPDDPNQQKNGTGFTNLSQYLNANQNANAGNTISQGVNQDINNINQNIAQAQNQFQQSAQASPLGNEFGNNFQNTEKQMNSAVSDPYAYINGAQNDPNGFTSANANAVQNFGNQYLNASYTGPQSLSNIGQLQSQANQVQGLASPTNQFGLLQRYLGGNTQYTTGQQNLDNALLGDSAAVKQAQAQTRGIANVVDQANAGAQQQAQTYAGQAQQLQADTRAAIGIDNANNMVGASNIAGPTVNAAGQAQQASTIDPVTGQKLGALQNIYNQVAEQYNNTIPTYNAVQQAYADANQSTYSTPTGGGNATLGLNAADLKALGLTAGEQSFGVSPLAAFQQGATVNPNGTPQAATLNGVATLDQAQNFNALSQLAGGISNAPTQFNASTAGTYTNPTINQGALQTAITNAQNKYNTTMNETGGWNAGLPQYVSANNTADTVTGANGTTYNLNTAAGQLGYLQNNDTSIMNAINNGQWSGNTVNGPNGYVTDTLSVNAGSNPINISGLNSFANDPKLISNANSINATSAQQQIDAQIAALQQYQNSLGGNDTFGNVGILGARGPMTPTII